MFVDVPMDEFFNTATAPLPAASAPRGVDPDTDALDRIARLLADAERPVLILGTDVWADGAEREALELVESAGLPAITNGMGRGVVPGGHPLLVTKARGKALNNADLVVVVGTPLDFRLGYGVFGGKEGAEPARVVHVADSPGQVSEPRDARRLRLRTPRLGAQRAGHRARPPRPTLLEGLGRGPAGHRPGGRGPRRRAARPRRPTRSIRPASTASCSRGWPTTPS